LIDADRQKLEDENRHLREVLKERHDYSNLVGTSGPMRWVMADHAGGAANTTVLLRGESGYGKARGKPSTTTRRAPVAAGQGELRGAAAGSDRGRALRLREGAFTGATAKKAGSNWPQAARCFSTKSVT
jgi:Nif-specific regulatory protein